VVYLVDSQAVLDNLLADIVQFAHTCAEAMREMRLIGPYLFILIGVVIGILATRLFSKNPLRYLPNVVLGVIGSFFGLFLRDIFDVTLGGKFLGAMLAAALGAVLLTVIGNLLFERLISGSGPDKIGHDKPPEDS